MSHDQVKSQLIGAGLAFMTAIGCIAYERLVKTHPYSTIGALVSLHYVPFWLYAMFVVDKTVRVDWAKLAAQRWWVLVFLASGITGPLWYSITRKQSVIVGAIYEVKYIAVMAVIYMVLGTSPLTTNTAIGIVLAMCSIYFISK